MEMNALGVSSLKRVVETSSPVFAGGHLSRTRNAVQKVQCGAAYGKPIESGRPDDEGFLLSASPLSRLSHWYPKGERRPSPAGRRLPDFAADPLSAKRPS